MEQKYLDKAEAHPILGPHYYAAHDAVAKVTDTFPFESVAPVVKSAVDGIYEKILEHVQNSLMCDAHHNLQGQIWRGIDDSVKALMTGEKWALNRYALEPKYGDGAKIREAVAKYIPAELQNARIADLEAEIERLSNDLKFYRQR